MITQFRLATPEDFEPIAALLEGCIGQMQRQNIDQWDSIYPNRDTVTADLENKRAWVLAKGSEIISSIVITPEPEVAYLDPTHQWQVQDGRFFCIRRLYVAPALQSHGIGALTVRCAEAEILRQGADSIRFDAFSLNTPLLFLAKKCGYQAIGAVQYRKGKYHLFEKVL